MDRRINVNSLGLNQISNRKHHVISLRDQTTCFQGLSLQTESPNGQNKGPPPTNGRYCCSVAARVRTQSSHGVQHIKAHNMCDDAYCAVVVELISATEKQPLMEGGRLHVHFMRSHEEKRSTFGLLRYMFLLMRDASRRRRVFSEPVSPLPFHPHRQRPATKQRFSCRCRRGAQQAVPTERARQSYTGSNYWMCRSVRGKDHYLLALKITQAANSQRPPCMSI